jgi:hypothetical protein
MENIKKLLSGIFDSSVKPSLFRFAGLIQTDGHCQAASFSYKTQNTIKFQHLLVNYKAKGEGIV